MDSSSLLLALFFFLNCVYISPKFRLASDGLILKDGAIFHDCVSLLLANKMQSSRLVPGLLHVSKVTSIFSIKVQGPRCCFQQDQLEKGGPLRIPGLSSSCV